MEFADTHVEKRLRDRHTAECNEDEFTVLRCVAALPISECPTLIPEEAPRDHAGERERVRREVVRRPEWPSPRERRVDREIERSVRAADAAVSEEWTDVRTERRDA